MTSEQKKKLDELKRRGRITTEEYNRVSNSGNDLSLFLLSFDVFTSSSNTNSYSSYDSNSSSGGGCSSSSSSSSSCD